MQLFAGGGPFVFDDGIDLAIRRNDFAPPAHAHCEFLFEEHIGPVCRPEWEQRWFATGGRLRSGATLLHSRTRPEAWNTWERYAAHTLPAARGSQHYAHF